MSIDIVEKLQRIKNPKKRVKLVLDMQKKNVKYLKKANPQLAEYVEKRGTAHFNVNVTEDFLEIIDLKTHQHCHPPGRLRESARTLGAWHHDQWIDWLHTAHRMLPGIEHGDKILAFLEDIYKELPALSERIRGGVIKLPKLRDGRRYSGATVFLGVFAGLHVLHYLRHTQVKDLIIIEPDPEVFCLSCHFVDYAAIDKQSRLLLHVGPNLPEEQITEFINSSATTASTWLRILPGYTHPATEPMKNTLNLRWRGLFEMMVPFDREMRNACYGMRNLRAGLPVNAQAPQLSANSRIAVVASGPSLSRDLEWLKAHQDKLIIFAVHSVVKVLRQHGIRPDFQCSLDTEMSEEIFATLDLDPAIPLLSFYKANPELLARFEKVLLINEAGKASPVLFHKPATHTHPTSGNLAIAGAVFTKPAQLYLLGLDLGFRDEAQAHVEGHWSVGRKGPEQAVPAPANFTQSEGRIYTKAYYESARLAVEAALQTLTTDTKVYNLSDGVQIAGSEAAYSDHLTLADYPEKKRDLDTFSAAFVDGTETEAWRPYQTSGARLLETIRTGILETVTLHRFDWHTFSVRLDIAWSLAMRRCMALEPGDFRSEIFNKLFHDLLAEWYRCMIFTVTPQEAEGVYRAGLAALEKIIDSLTWPEELDDESLAEDGEAGGRTE